MHGAGEGGVLQWCSRRGFAGMGGLCRRLSLCGSELGVVGRRGAPRGVRSWGRGGLQGYSGRGLAGLGVVAGGRIWVGVAWEGRLACVCSGPGGLMWALSPPGGRPHEDRAVCRCCTQNGGELQVRSRQWSCNAAWTRAVKALRCRNVSDGRVTACPPEPLHLLCSTRRSEEDVTLPQSTGAARLAGS